MTQDLYTCECCGGTFEKGWSDEEMRLESVEKFPELKDEDAAVVCDDCYKKIENYINTMPRLKISFGKDQIYIDRLITEMEAEGKIVGIHRTTTDELVNYILDFPTEMNVYEFGYRQGTWLRDRSFV
jgi:hypothetical protein